MSVKPYGTEGSKKEEVRQMFDNIAPTYDLLNHALSMNIDRIWRRKAIKLVKLSQAKTVLDVATGTGDLAIATIKANPDKIIGIDLSAGMIEIGLKKIKNKGLDKKIDLIVGDSEDLPFAEKSFDAVTVAFGVRNFENPVKGLKEMHRVTRPGGMIVVLEFMLPKGKLIEPLYRFYFRRIIPMVGKVISKDFSAYKYLPDSVKAFPQRNDFLQLLTQAGYKDASYKSLSAGIAGLYVATR
ncbi:MAG: bifunctional demethylmenaquinone methyltransferase/2-methoxy-6-polyprenyl-1,4-benzoquinol methylase UbiE [Bacteroidetes bacterium]|jgi:demethylmenaquinone methyltransferase / 2-methoxy-6-polyprenyl-1,4-benzoquinol methylase|nr:bifunctional demethylmenaquinone methyltransferase/2-methoxy-6-polyprenyl-1,4-benzoquinol methylase UbiE [Bacteroidota bacterium]MBT3749532.1 bifunctional demethylmenaquinone methyltransferase/2-methoxy-6-polyprenyl-1,4-benzoquinol methylase UbiE [Bacteroidota bacterium]MBT4398072.1 bifunctional demethylmenaquinone methyltransferase/2-methoxy-6-polyprenyl-1,4-benzoquinol methylase UbiE [Bacteroidota bacterium]MBT4409926.1 bifunctional demethylmenaquinone methyltransferase/2-methoxy-6-polypren